VFLVFRHLIFKLYLYFCPKFKQNLYIVLLLLVHTKNLYTINNLSLSYLLVNLKLCDYELLKLLNQVKFINLLYLKLNDYVLYLLLNRVKFINLLYLKLYDYVLYLFLNQVKFINYKYLIFKFNLCHLFLINILYLILILYIHFQ
jgi:hypothetical protein